MAKGVLNTMIDDQVGYYQDMFTWKFMIPLLISLGLIGGGIAVVADKAHPAKKDDDDAAAETKAERDHRTHALILGAILVGVGILGAIAIKFILFIRHPRAGVEQAGAEMLLGAV